jgi:hypothetical protein
MIAFLAADPNSPGLGQSVKNRPILRHMRGSVEGVRGGWAQPPQMPMAARDPPRRLGGCAGVPREARPVARPGDRSAIGHALAGGAPVVTTAPPPASLPPVPSHAAVALVPSIRDVLHARPHSATGVA